MDYAVRTHELTRVFGNFTAVDRLTLQIRPGEVCGFLGANGAGKSTAIRMLCGILQPTSGSAEVLGYDVATQTEKVKGRIGYMSQKFSLYEDLSVLDNLTFYAGIYSIPVKERAARITEMLDLAGLCQRDRTLAAELSVGWKQRLALCCAIISRPALVFLDEPTSGVSPTGRRQFFNLIQDLANHGTTIIVTTHFMDEAERCDQIAFMSEGRLLAFDSPDRLKTCFIKGQMAEISVPNPMQRVKDIEALPFVLEASVFGSHIHALLNRAEDLPLLSAAAGAESRLISPTLEDVFITLAKRREQGGLSQ